MRRLAAARERQHVCRAWHEAREVKVLLPGCRRAEGKRKGKGVTARRKPNAKLRGDEQEPDTRCDTSGTSGHVTTKSSICIGVCFINPASTQRPFRVLPREICLLFAGTERGAIRAHRQAEVSRGHRRWGEERSREAPPYPD